MLSSLKRERMLTCSYSKLMFSWWLDFCTESSLWNFRNLTKRNLDGLLKGLKILIQDPIMSPVQMLKSELLLWAVGLYQTVGKGNGWKKNVELHFKRVIQIWAPSPFHKLRLSLSHKAPGIVESRLSLSQSSGRNWIAQLNPSLRFWWFHISIRYSMKQSKFLLKKKLEDVMTTWHTMCSAKICKPLY